MSHFWLNNVVSGGKLILKNNQVFLYAFKRPNGENIVFAWTVMDTSHPMTLQLPARDIYGNSVKASALGAEPVIFFSSSGTAGDLLAKVKSAADL
jgi:hypothetical protein